MSSLHDPYQGATPSQKYAAAAHRERLQRFRNASRPAEIVVPIIAVITVALPPISNGEMKLACEVTSERTYGQVGLIQRAVVEFFPKCTMGDILSNRRMQRVVKPRQIAMYLSWLLTNRSLPDIGRRFGGRDHTTVLHAVRKIERLVMTDPVFASEINALKATIPEGA